MSWRAQNRSQDAKIRSTRGTRSDCLIPESCGIQRYLVTVGQACIDIDRSLIPSADGGGDETRNQGAHSPPSIAISISSSTGSHGPSPLGWKTTL